MWPWGHLAVAYLLYSVYAARRYDRAPRALPAIAVAIGSQFPDLIDKPLAWTFDVLPGGRTLSHSLLFAAALVLVVFVAVRRFDRVDPTVAFAFVIGHVVHLLADIPPSTLRGDFTGTTYFFWPVVPYHPVDEPGGIIDAFLTYEMGTYEVAQLGLFAVAIAVWYRDGAPGLEYASRTLRRIRPSSS
ncbi:metal-dependent hydrolase [Natrialbaceae archaeon GCM10025810]|uniref:metal-dependent hydrolase n=1 Tax=Halovalidus salilacus TaxID=3075124 RepID=UPI003622C120